MSKPDIKYDSESVTKQAQEYIDTFRLRLKYIADETLSELYANCLPYIESDAWTNYREALRLELEHDYRTSRFKDEWAKNFRRAVFVENRDELASLISKDILERIKILEDSRQEFEVFRYTPLGDDYQSVRKKADSAIEELKAAREALNKTRAHALYAYQDFGDKYYENVSNEIAEALARIDKFLKENE